MLKPFKFILLFLSLLILQGCTYSFSPRYFHFEENQRGNYYYTEIKEKLSNKESYTLQVFDTNLYKYFPVDEEDNIIIKNFINSLNNNNFLEEAPDDFKSKEKFRLIITFKDNNNNEGKYIFKIYNNKFTKLHPFDGRVSEDIINMEDIPLHYNLYDFCTYVQNKK